MWVRKEVQQRCNTSQLLTLTTADPQIWCSNKRTAKCEGVKRKRVNITPNSEAGAEVFVSIKGMVRPADGEG